MKGFKKDGKFRPTGRKKSALTVSDLKDFESELDKGDKMLEHRDRLKEQGASSIQHDKLILAQKKKLNKMSKELKLKARKKESLSYNDSKEDVFKRIKEKGFKIKEVNSEIPEDERDSPEEDTYITNRFEISEEQILGAMDGKSTAGEMIDKLTNTTDNERLRFDIDSGNPLHKLMKEGKAHVETIDGKPVWIKGK